MISSNLDALGIRACVVDNDHVFGKKIVSILIASGIQCAGAFSKGEDAARRIPTMRPDVVLMNVRMPEMSGVECASILLKSIPTLKVIMMTGFPRPEVLSASAATGACGFIIKPFTHDELLSAVRAVLNGGVWLSLQAFAMVSTTAKTPSIRDGDTALLTRRQNEIIALLAKGYLYKEIASSLGISRSTVTQHVHSCYAKLGASNRTEAVNIWSRNYLS